MEEPAGQKVDTSELTDDNISLHQDELLGKGYTGHLNKLIGVITVEPVYFLFAFACTAADPAVQQYVYRHIALSYGPNITDRVSGCSPNSSFASETDAVQAQASQSMMWNDIIGTVPVIFSTFFLSSYSDFVGRKLVLIYRCHARDSWPCGSLFITAQFAFHTATVFHRRSTWGQHGAPCSVPCLHCRYL